jgi:hypothetical protein
LSVALSSCLILNVSHIFAIAYNHFIALLFLFRPTPKLLAGFLSSQLLASPLITLYPLPTRTTLHSQAATNRLGFPWPLEGARQVWSFQPVILWAGARYPLLSSGGICESPPLDCLCQPSDRDCLWHSPATVTRPGEGGWADQLAEQPNAERRVISTTTGLWSRATPRISPFTCHGTCFNH